MREITNIHQHSCFSFQDGIATPEEIISTAKQKGLKSIAITDHGHTHAHARFFLEAKKQDVKPILGTEAYIIHSLDEWRMMKEKIALDKQKNSEDIEFDAEKALLDKANRKILYRKGHLVLLARNRTGLANIYNLTFKAHKLGYYQKPRMDKKMLIDHSDGVVASSACMGGVISQKLWGFEKGEITWKEVIAEAREFHEIFNGNFFLELQSNEADGQKFINGNLIKIHYETGIPLTVAMDAHYINPDDWQAQQLLHLLLTHRGKEGITLNNLPEGYDFRVKSLFIKTADELWNSFKKWNPEVDEKILNQAFDNTLLIDSLIDNFEPDTSMRLPSLPYEDTFEELKQSSNRGLLARNLHEDKKYVDRLNYELDVIKQKGITNYFLVVRNICDSARKEMLIGPGRGSAAGSLICYLNGITNIDPIEHKLMFERFINIDRIETPDIDLDFQDVDRIKDILRRDFGDNNVACISVYGTNQIKGLIKDVCRVYDIDHKEANTVNAQIEREMKALFKEGETKSAITIKIEDIYRLSPTFNAFIKKYPQIENSIKTLYGREHHVGRHASGVIIGDDLPSETSVFTSKGIIQASFSDGIVNKSASSMGLVKFDILGLATLEVISHACKLIAAKNNKTYEEVLKEIDPKTMNFNDENIMKTVFWNGNMTGIFSVTSQGMMKLFQKVKPTSFDDVSAVCALFRPGPLGSKMDELFANRKNGIEKISYDHEILQDIMKDTYGCLVYQEQMLEIGRRIGKMSWKDTNRLRKLFLKKDKSKQDDFIKKEEDELKATLISGAVENGLTEAKGEELWTMLSKFGGYGFNACLTGNTVLKRSAANGVSKAEVTIKELFDNQESKKSIAKKMKYYGINVLQLDSDLRIRPGKLKKVYFSGVQKCYKVVTESGKSINATANHRFYTPNGYRFVSELNIDDDLVVEGKHVILLKGKSKHAKNKCDKSKGFKCGDKNPGWIDGRSVHKTNAKIAVAERSKNRCELCGYKKNKSVHSLEFAHINCLELFDGDYSKYHSADNILHLCGSCHKSFDTQKAERPPRWSVGLPSAVEKIVSIEYAGEHDTYDVEMDTEGHNFIANGFVSHNSHAKSYGMVTMQTAYLRTYYPNEFFAALLSKGQAAELQTYVNDIRKQGFDILPVDVNASSFEYTNEKNSIRLALSSAKGIGPAAVQKIIENQPYNSFFDFLSRGQSSKTIVNALVKVGAFSEIEPTRTISSLLKMYEVYRDQKLSLKKNIANAPNILNSVENIKDDENEIMQFERELLGFNIRGTPFSLFERSEKIEKLLNNKIILDSDWNQFLDDESRDIIICPFFVSEIKEKAQKNGKMMAWLRLCDMNNKDIEVPAFGNIWEFVRDRVKIGGVYITTVHRRSDDPTSFIAGKPGWTQTQKTANSSFIDLDKVNV